MAWPARFSSGITERQSRAPCQVGATGKGDGVV